MYIGVKITWYKTKKGKEKLKSFVGEELYKLLAKHKVDGTAEPALEAQQLYKLSGWNDERLSDTVPKYVCFSVSHSKPYIVRQQAFRFIFLCYSLV